MKNTLITISLLLTQFCIGQTINSPTPEAFENISINSRSIRSIWATNGEEINVQNLLGQPSTIQVNDPTPGVMDYTYFYSGYNISFTTHIASNGNLLSIDITSSTPVIWIAGVSLRVGDSINKLSNYDRNQDLGGGESISFSPNNDETIYLIVDFDTKTGTITKMYYLQLT